MGPRSKVSQRSYPQKAHLLDIMVIPAKTMKLMGCKAKELQSTKGNWTYGQTDIWIAPTEYNVSCSLGGRHKKKTLTVLYLC